MQRTLLKYEKDKRTRGQMDRETNKQRETEGKGEGERATRQTAKTYANCMV